MFKWLNPKLSEVLEMYMEIRKTLSPRTVKLTRLAWSYLIDFAGDIRVDRFDDVAGYQSYCARTVSPTSVRMYRKSIAPLFSWCIERHYFKKSPFEKVRSPRPVKRIPRVYTPSEFRRMFDACPNDYWKAALLIAYTTGARKSAIENLCKADIDFENGLIRIQDKYDTDPGKWEWHPKDREDRTLPLIKPAADLILELVYSSPSPYFLLKPSRYFHLLELKKMDMMSDEMKLYPFSNFDRTFRKIKKRAGVKGRFHDFRSSFASEMLSGGCSLVEVRDLLGHSSIKTTEVYLGSNSELVNKARAVSTELLGVNASSVKT